MKWNLPFCEFAAREQKALCKLLRGNHPQSYAAATYDDAWTCKICSQVKWRSAHYVSNQSCSYRLEKKKNGVIQRKTMASQMKQMPF